MAKKETVVLDAKDALCAEIDPDLWFPNSKEGGHKDSYYNMDQAKRFCSQCPLTVQCLLTALGNKEEHGIWGGSTPRDRKFIRNNNQARDFILRLRQRYNK